MSRGPGRCERRVIELVMAAPERRQSRSQLDAVLVEREGHDPSNVLRSIKSLSKKHLVRFRDERRKEDSIVELAPEVERVPESKVDELLREIAEGAGT